MTLENYLEQDARLYPSKVAVICGDCAMGYAQLWEAVQHRAEQLKEAGVKPGFVYVFRGSQDIDFLLTYFATHLLGAIAAPLESDAPDQRFNEIQQQVEGEQSAGLADVLFTTGTTGLSKGVMISHATIIAEAENLSESQGFCHETVFVISGPLNHIGSLSKIFPVIYKGGTLIITEGMKDLDSFFAAFDYPSDKLATFLVPSSIRMILQFAKTRLHQYCDKIDFIETGGAAIVQPDMNELCKILPNTRLYNTYASTETGIIATHNYNSDHCVAGCLGRAMKHSEFFITDEGHIACKGKTLMQGYIGNEELTRSVLKDSVVYTADKGFIDEEGRLNMSGRSGDVINIGGFKVNPLEVEEVALSYNHVSDCICIPYQHPVMGTNLKLLLVWSSEDVAFDKRALARYLADKLERYKVPMVYELVESIRKTYNGKLDRKSYLS